MDEYSILINFHFFKKILKIKTKKNDCIYLKILIYIFKKMSIENTIYMMKFNFYKNDIRQYAKVRIVAIINNACLVEDIITKNRVWVMKYDIYPLNNHDMGGYWTYSQYYTDIAKQEKLI